MLYYLSAVEQCQLLLIPAESLPIRRVARRPGISGYAGGWGGGRFAFNSRRAQNNLTAGAENYYLIERSDGEGRTEGERVGGRGLVRKREKMVWEDAERWRKKTDGEMGGGENDRCRKRKREREADRGSEEQVQDEGEGEREEAAEVARSWRIAAGLGWRSFQTGPVPGAICIFNGRQLNYQRGDASPTARPA